MLPQEAAVVLPDSVPALLEGDEARVEAVAFGPTDDFAATAAAEGSQEVNGVRNLQSLDIRLDGRLK